MSETKKDNVELYPRLTELLSELFFNINNKHVIVTKEMITHFYQDKEFINDPNERSSEMKIKRDLKILENNGIIEITNKNYQLTEKLLPLLMKISEYYESYEDSTDEPTIDSDFYALGIITAIAAVKKFPESKEMLNDMYEKNSNFGMPILAFISVTEHKEAFDALVRYVYEVNSNKEQMY